MTLPIKTSEEESPPQPLGDFKPVDEWQVHLNALLPAVRGGRSRDYYQTMASGDYRLAHALAIEFYDAQRNRTGLPDSVIVQEWGCGNGNLAACFLTHLKTLDSEGGLYRRVRYVLVDNNRDILESALHHPDLEPHRERVSSVRVDAQDLAGLKDKSVEWIICNELWNDLPTKVMLRKEGEVVEEQMRPNLSDAKSKEFPDWFGFVKAFAAKDVEKLKSQPSFLDKILWEKDYQSIDWKRVPYRKTITEFLKPIEELVLVPVNVGAFATVKEAIRVLRPGGRFMSFDAGTPDRETAGNPDKPCYSLLGGQYSFIVNFALCEAVARHLGAKDVTIELQKEFVGRMLGKNVMTLVELLNTYPFPGRLKAWERDLLTLRTLTPISRVYSSPYRRKLEYPVRPDAPDAERAEMLAMLRDLPETALPDTIAYLTEDEVLAALPDLEALGFPREEIHEILRNPFQTREIDYHKFSLVG